MHLQHIHIPTPTSYRLANRLQSLLVQRHLEHHHPSTSSASSSPSTSTPPAPTLLTFSTPPTYTSGRRQSLTPEQIKHLTSGPPPAIFEPSPRGGLLTFHGPGQLTAYLVLHLRSHGLGVREYVEFLEQRLVGTSQRFGVKGFTLCKYPGVWVKRKDASIISSGDGVYHSSKNTGIEMVKTKTKMPGTRKGSDVPLDAIAKMVSVGVHVRRGVTGFGAGFNITTNPGWWRRFDACGIEGVSMSAMGEVSGSRGLQGEAGLKSVARVLAQEVGFHLQGVEGAQTMPVNQVLGLLEAAMAGEEVERHLMAEYKGAQEGGYPGPLQA